MLQREQDGYAPVRNVSSRGRFPCHIALSPAEEIVAVANYGEGNVAVFDSKLNLLSLHTRGKPDGAGFHPRRQEKAHAHQVSFHGREIWCCDLGRDEIRKIENCCGWQEGTPVVSCAPGGGIRHIAMWPDKPIFYAVMELTSQVCTFTLEKGKVRLVHRASLCRDREERTGGAAIRLCPEKKLLLASQRGEDTVSVFSLEDPCMPALVGRYPCGGKGPRDILMVGDYLLCACQNDDRVTMLKMADHGELEWKNAVRIPSPVCLLAVPENSKEEKDNANPENQRR